MERDESLFNTVWIVPRSKHIMFVKLDEKVVKIAICRKWIKIPRVELRESHRLAHYTSSTPTWPPTRHRKGPKKDENHNKTDQTDK